MEGAMKYFPKKLLPHEIFTSMVSWATKIFLTNFPPTYLMCTLLSVLPSKERFINPPNAFPLLHQPSRNSIFRKIYFGGQKKHRSYEMSALDVPALQRLTYGSLTDKLSVTRLAVQVLFREISKYIFNKSFFRKFPVILHLIKIAGFLLEDF